MRLQFLSQVFLVTVGVIIAAVAVIVFYAPGDVAPAGLPGLAVILNRLFEMPIGLTTFVMSIPILYIGYRMLGGLRTLIWTIYVTILYSAAIDMLTPFFSGEPISEDRLFNAIFAGVMSGFGTGLVLRGGAVFSGMSTIARIMNDRLGMPLSSTYLYTNLIIIGLAGVFLGWESALLSLIALTLEGAMTDYMLEGPSVIRTVTIITNHPREVSDVILYQMKRGVTGWEAKGMYTEQSRHILFVTIPRSQVNNLRNLVFDVDPTAFLVVGQGHVAYGGEFKRAAPNGKN